MSDSSKWRCFAFVCAQQRRGDVSSNVHASRRLVACATASILAVIIQVAPTRAMCPACQTCSAPDVDRVTALPDHAASHSVLASSTFAGAAAAAADVVCCCLQYFGGDASECGFPSCERMILTMQGSYYEVANAYSHWGPTNVNDATAPGNCQTAWANRPSTGTAGDGNRAIGANGTAAPAPTMQGANRQAPQR